MCSHSFSLEYTLLALPQAQEARQVDELAAQLEDAAGSVQLYTSGTSRDLLKVRGCSIGS